MAGSYCWAKIARGKRTAQSKASRIQMKPLFTVDPRREVRINQGGGDWTAMGAAGRPVLLRPQTELASCARPGPFGFPPGRARESARPLRRSHSIIPSKE